MVKVALLIGVSEYGNGLSPLPAASKDVEAMREVLENPEIGGFDWVTPLINPERQAMEEAIYTLFVNRNKDDLLLLFFSGHGVKDDGGNLYLATRNTRKEQEALVQPTAVAANYIQNIMSNSRSKRQVVILDCCFSGAFAQGMTAKDDSSVPVKQQLGGEGRAVLTSSTSTQYSFELPGFDLSIYTHFLVEGIRTGIADRDRDSAVSIDELHEYAREKVQDAAPGKMKPEIYPIREGGKILLAKVRVDDPTLKYRQEVQQRLRDGKFTITARKLLNLKREKLGLSAEVTAAIEDEVLKPYHEHKANLQEYEQALYEEIQQELPLNEATRNDLKDLQQELGLTDDDVARIETRIISPIEAVSSSNSVASLISQDNSRHTIVQLNELENVFAKDDDLPTVVLPIQLSSLEDAGGTDVGRQRHHNEDCFSIYTKFDKPQLPKNRVLQAHGLYILCDGLGGHADGEIASKLAVNTLQKYFQEHWIANQLPTEDSIRQAVYLANQAIYQVNQQNARSGVGRMGTTLVMLLIQGTQAAVAHVGDSRLYRLTGKRGLEQITVDHQVGQREIARGVEASIAYARPDAYQLTQALGPRDENSINPDVEFFEIDEDSLFILVSDGLSDNDLLEIHWQTHLLPLLSTGANLERGITELIDLANQYNGHDNITAVLVRAKIHPKLS
ncbi:serine/threonine phosphatase [Dendronalium sp. ChiSLP03b]|uniref:serine/threonine phosphatase n=1 Tax=Dendronalium sp. ChiSLP03b TaxID=3075381 RepID=UPI002AD45741|nr:serine/threonine phosphatase [Dendronalium sp. ChiSLP03b]MDZ8204186.1 serine/threonine phosphatase [Dendronalium sp. ChiSLP03b]